MTQDQNTDEVRPELEVKLSELEILRQSLEDAQKKERQVYDQLLRLGAEFENYRKRADQRIIEARKNGREDNLLGFLYLYDALIHADHASRKATDLEAIKKGISLVLSEFERFLKDQGVHPIETAGLAADPNLHDVIAQEPRDGVEEGIIIEEIQRGFKLSGHVLRPAKVKVAAKKESESI